MKLYSTCAKLASLFVFATAWILAHVTASAATLSVTPSAISNLYSGVITVQAGVLTNGETVRIEKFADANTNGVVDANEPRVQSFLLTDGQVAMIGGATNINVPGDYGPTNSATVTPLNFQAGGVGQSLAGQYAYVLSSPSGRFTPVTNLFNVTNGTFAQSFTGTVLSSGTNVAYASVMLFTPPSGNDDGMNFIAGALANGSGNYTIRAPAGTYLLLTTANGFVADFSVTPVLTLGAGATVNTNLSLTAATRTISGKVVDSVNTNLGLAGLLIVCQSTSDSLAIGFSDASGNFTVPVSPAVWKTETDEQENAFYGYLRLNDDTNQVDTTAGNVSGVVMPLLKSTALIYGSVKDAQNQPLAGVGLFADQDNGSGPYSASATTDQNGNYALGIIGGTWRADVDNNNPGYLNYIFSAMNNTNLSAGQALLQNFVGIVATNHISGFVKDDNNNPITNVFVSAFATINSTPFNIGSSTDTNGNYSFIVANGSWTLNLDCGYLSSLGLPCPNSKTTNILGADAVVNFTASNLHITTTNLPAGTQGIFYSQSFTASNGLPPYAWSLTPGQTNLPPGMSLSTNGVLSGTPGASGLFGFSARVTDANNNNADQPLFLSINPAPLVITTTNLPNGTNGFFYFQQLNATGGQPPYTWYMPGPSTLPSGLNLSTNGLLSGTLATPTNGTFVFSVSVFVNNPYQVATQQLSLTIAPGPLQVTTTSPLPNATQGSFYSVPLAATGGVPPYSWSLAPASPSLPPGLNLATNGVLSGIPSSSGGFSFTVRVRDSVLTTVDWFLSLTINATNSYPTTLLTGPGRPGSGQFQFTFNTSPGWNYTIQSSSNLTFWNSVLTIGGSGAPITVIDPNATVNQRFYRVKVQQ